MPSYVAVDDLRTQVEIPKDGTLSRTIVENEQVKVVLFGFAGGQQLSRHSVASPAIVEVVQGQVRFALDGEEKELAPGSWLFMEANLPHAVYARTDSIMLLTLLS